MSFNNITIPSSLSLRCLGGSVLFLVSVIALWHSQEYAPTVGSQVYGSQRICSSANSITEGNATAILAGVMGTIASQNCTSGIHVSRMDLWRERADSVLPPLVATSQEQMIRLIFIEELDSMAELSSETRIGLTHYKPNFIPS